MLILYILTELNSGTTISIKKQCKLLPAQWFGHFLEVSKILNLGLRFYFIF
tara:strand:- start:310 stop:462 length:153 start_codon:yes stop_codon:yes gene_type:complete